MSRLTSLLLWSVALQAVEARQRTVLAPTRWIAIAGATLMTETEPPRFLTPPWWSRGNRIAAAGPRAGGTIEVGTGADLLLFSADPSAEIHNIRTLETVMRDGSIMDIKALPAKPVWVKR